MISHPSIPDSHALRHTLGKTACDAPWPQAATFPCIIAKRANPLRETIAPLCGLFLCALAACGGSGGGSTGQASQPIDDMVDDPSGGSQFTTLGANPAGIAYSSLKNVGLYGKATGLLVTGRCNRYDSAFATARSQGAEVLAYLNAVERPDQRVCALDQDFYMGDYGSVPLWPYPTYGQRVIWPNHHLTDMRPGSAWILSVVTYVENLMREGKVDGVFLDVLGARPWGITVSWESWPLAEKNEWTDGCIDLVRRLDASRRAINPNFIIINNNVWDRGDTRGFAAEQYVDGVIIEHPVPGLQPWHKDYVQRPFSDLGHRRVLVIARTAEDARLWSGVPGVSHVSDQMYYGHPSVPPVSFNALDDR
ncbi:MAG: hypothetical protein ABW034_01565 [Steroidobacteraceae bacterium]